MMQKRKCVTCGRVLSIGINGNDFFLLLPCQCYMCAGCAFEKVVDRKFADLECTCGAKSGGETKTIQSVAYFQSDRQKANDGKKIPIKRHEPDATNDPARYYASLYEHMKEGDVHPKKKMILSLSYPHETEDHARMNLFL